GWSYTLARRAALQHSRAESRRRRRVSPMPDSSDALAVADRVRTTTLAALKTAARDAISRLRDQLPPEDAMLLVLRVDRGLAWNELARVFLDEPSPDDATFKRHA